MAAVGLRKIRVRPRRALGWSLQESTSGLGELPPFVLDLYILLRSGQAYKHIFTSPSSVEKETKATRSGNARLHGMTRVTTASLAYIATQVRLAVALFRLSTTDHQAAPFCTVILLGLLQD